MADGKKSFVAYVDWQDTFKALPDDKAGQLIKFLFAYVNDENPETDDILINAVFANIKRQLKRDLHKWESTSEVRSEVGRLGGIKSGEARRKQAEANEAIGLKVKQNEHVNVNVNVNVKKKEEKTEFDYSFISKEWIALFKDWITYKNSRNEKYKTQQSIEACYRNLLKLSSNDTSKGRLVLDQAIGNNYAGLFPLKSEVFTKSIDPGPQYKAVTRDMI